MRAIYLLLCLLLCLLFSQITWANERDLMLLGTYENQDVQGWVMSEKLDGVTRLLGWQNIIKSSRTALTRTRPILPLNFHLLPLMANFLVNVINLKKLLLSRNPLKVIIGQN